MNLLSIEISLNFSVKNYIQPLHREFKTWGENDLYFYFSRPIYAFLTFNLCKIFSYIFQGASLKYFLVIRLRDGKQTK